MGYLVDTCIFIKQIKSGDKIIKIATCCKSEDKKFCITDIVMDELKPGRKIIKKDPESASLSIGTMQNLDFSIKSGIVKNIRVKDAESKYNQNFNNIRKRYYDHLKDPSFVKTMIEKKEISEEEFANKSYRYKDYGECSCIAVAMENPNKYIIVSEDNGRIFAKPEINLFHKYKKSHKINVIDFNIWSLNIGLVNDEIAVNT